MPQTRAEWARDYRTRGWNPIPLKPGEKSPVGTAWQRSRVEDDDLDDVFAGEGNLGLVLGPPSGNLIDVDQDTPEAIWLAPRFLPPTGTTFGRFSKPGSHYLYQVNTEDTIRRIQYEDPDGSLLLELRGEGHQTMVPPSIHPGGEDVAWEKYDVAGSVSAFELERATGWLATAVMFGRHWGDWDHKHHNLVLHLTGGMLRAGVSDDLILNFVKSICWVGQDTDWEDRRKAVESTIDKYRSGADTTGFPSLSDLIGDPFVRKMVAWLKIDTAKEDVPNTDHGNATRLVHYFGDRLRYVPDWGTWLIWDSTRWERDRRERAYGYARALPQHILEEAGKAKSDDKRAETVKWSFKSQDVARMNATLRIGRTDERISLDSNDLDRDPWVLNVQNGTVNLRTGGIEAHNPGDLHSKLAPVVYDPSAQAPLWTAFLDKVLQGNQGLIDFVQRLVGYSLTGLTTEQVFVVLWGPPGTGKTTFIETIRRVMGDYATNAEADTFMVKQRQGRASPDIARLQAARLVTASETDEGQKLAVSLVKRLSGGDRMTASNLYAAPFEFDPVLKLWIATNNKPRIPADEEATWERLVFVPFTVQMRNSPDRVQGYADLLTREHAGILAWAVEGCLKWLSDGLGRPPEVEEATAEYRSESDELGDFLDEMTERDEAESVPSSTLYRAYAGWAPSKGFKALNIRRFKDKMEARGFASKRTKDGMVWVGLRLTVDLADIIDLSGMNSTGKGGRTPFGAPRRQAG